MKEHTITQLLNFMKEISTIKQRPITTYFNCEGKLNPT